MYCPRCSKEATLKQKFCKSCGLSLSEFSKLLTVVDPELTPKQPMYKSWLLLFAVLGGVIAITVFDVDFPLIAIIWVILAFLFWGGDSGSEAIYLPLRWNLFRRNKNKADVGESEVTKKLSPERVYETLPSVTECTTANLEQYIEQPRSKDTV